jgi:hypothetical protein
VRLNTFEFDDSVFLPQITRKPDAIHHGVPQDLLQTFEVWRMTVINLNLQERHLLELVLLQVTFHWFLTNRETLNVIPNNISTTDGFK